ncbi:MAG: DNA polymerase subunit beta [Methanobrevibacter sp.]|jgi:predicted nucleotidyltransferase|nr:DNA polymerase subunit beta [Candidatus Methanoflexus mossambicus]
MENKTDFNQLKVRTRDFIYTKDDLFFATTNYIHPANRILSFLRYIPDENGDREKNGKNYRKVDSDEAYDYLRKNHPEYLYQCDITNIEMMGVPYDKISEVIKPEKRLKEIREEFNKIYEKNTKNKDELNTLNFYKKLIDLSDFFHYVAGIDYNNLGISGSILPGLQKSEISDLDFVVYGLKNHKIAVESFKNNKNKKITIIDENNENNENNKSNKIKKTITLNSIDNSYWEKVYDKRIKDESLTKKEFIWYESRKNNRGVINGTLFDILATKNYDEIKGNWGDVKYNNVGKASVECVVSDAIGSYDNPAIYKIKDMKITGGDDFPISEIASFTHTYAGQVLEGEKIIAKGKVEEVIENKNLKYYRLVIGTTRESIDEYVKLKDGIY